MIAGIVSREGVPLIELAIAGREWPAIVDSGFNGDLELPETLNSDFPGRLVGRVTSYLAAGQIIEEDVFLIDFPFDGEVVRAEATFAVANEILIGTRLLRRHRLTIDFPKATLSIERS